MSKVFCASKPKKEIPDDIVNIMLDRQFEQTGVRDVSVFERDPVAGKSSGGFNWNETPEGYSIWLQVLDNGIFNYFYAFIQEINSEINLEYE